MWKLYRVVLRLRSPLHVGYIKIGNLMRTRPYVLGKTIWGAVTAALALSQFNGDFRKAQEQTRASLAFSYFYPASKIASPLWPHYTKDGLCYGAQQMPAAEFERRFLSVYGSTALDYSCNAALAGSLHEVEFVSPYDRYEGKPIYLVGYIFECQGASLGWQDVLECIRLGGERKYGWGRVSCERLDESSDMFGMEVKLNTERPRVCLRTEEPLRAHARADAVHHAVGLIEPLIGRETQDATRFGESFPQQEVPFCWAPGSLVQAEYTLKIDPYGIWCS